MADVPVTDIDLTGTDPDAALQGADGAGERVLTGQSSGASVFLLVRNGDTAAHDVILRDQRSSQPYGATAFDADVTINVGAGADVLISPLATSRFGDDNGDVFVDYSAATGMSIAAFRN